MRPAAINSNGTRRSILDLAPLELDCMNALWPCGEATVRQIQEALKPTRPRAYTTIMTILDRLAQKGVVERRKSGRAWVYRPNMSAEQARSHAVTQVVDGFFGGSSVALASHLNTSGVASPRESGNFADRVSISASAMQSKVASAPAAESRSPAKSEMQDLDTTLL
jgi:predicted transcriptional regulator